NGGWGLAEPNDPSLSNEIAVFVRHVEKPAGFFGRSKKGYFKTENGYQQVAKYDPDLELVPGQQVYLQKYETWRVAEIEDAPAGIKAVFVK
ncbi:MAG: hypothetical protein ACK4FA_01645, partial [Candidatus Paceibacteria bacterium]